MLRSLEPVPVEILLIERNLQDAGKIINVLQDRKIPHRLTLFRDGEEALAFVRREGRFAHAPRPHLVLLPARPAKCTALELIHEIRQESSSTSTAIVLVTSSPLEVYLAPRNELHGCLAKPIQPDALVAVVRNRQNHDAYEAHEKFDALMAPAGIG